jgi:hypothetical protein
MNFAAQPVDILLERSDSCPNSFELGNANRGHRANQCAEDVIGRARERGADTGPENCYKDPQEGVHEYS